MTELQRLVLHHLHAITARLAALSEAGEGGPDASAPAPEERDPAPASAADTA